jgi:hypothetical protein
VLFGEISPVTTKKTTGRVLDFTQTAFLLLFSLSISLSHLLAPHGTEVLLAGKCSVLKKYGTQVLLAGKCSVLKK